MASAVHFAGNIPGASSLMSAFDVFVSSSHTEGLPMVVLEAMGAVVPVVATAVGEIPQVLSEGRYGVLVPPGDVEGLASAVASVLRDPETAHDRAVLAQRHVSGCYAVDPWLDRILDVYQSAMS